MSRSSLSFLSLLSLVTLGACGPSQGDLAGDDTVDAAPADLGLAYHAFSDALNRATCERTLRCDAETTFADVDDCLANIDPEIVRGRLRMQASITAGRVAFDPDVADACLPAYATSACAQPSYELAAACAHATTGTVTPGGACTAHFDCAAAGADDRSYCFTGCTGIFGTEEDDLAGTCVDDSPIGTPACD